MAEGKETEKITTGKFFTSDPNAKSEGEGYYFISADAPREHAAAGRVNHEPFRKTANTFMSNKLLRNTAICAVAALVVWGIASSGTPAGKDASEAIKSVVNYEMDLEDDLGDLKFVDNMLDEDSAPVSAGTQEDAAADEAAAGAAFVYPLDGIVTATFAENGSGAIIAKAGSADVRSSRAGKVSEVSGNFVSILNNDNSVTTYFGVEPGVQTGDSVEAGQVIGQLLSEALYVEQDREGEKTDPLS